jgi:hypothetical protein
MSQTVTVQQYPNQSFNSGPSGVTFTTPGISLPIEILTNYTNPGIYTLTSKPCDGSVPITASLSQTWQAAGYVFVNSSGVNIGTQEAVPVCPATLLVQPPNPLPPPSHGGGTIALLVFLLSAIAWHGLRRVQRRLAFRGK